MKSNRKLNIWMILAVATLVVFGMAAPAMADRLVTFEGMITSEGKFAAENGREYWVFGENAGGIKNNVGHKVEITGLLRENRDTGSLGTFYREPSIEVYSYDFVKEMKEMK